MLGLELLVGHMAAWEARKGRRVGTGTGAQVDSTLGTYMDKLHDLVASVLQGDPALVRLELEAAHGLDNPRTKQRVRLALEEAIDQDRDFAHELSVLIEKINWQTSSRRTPSTQTAVGNINSTVIQAGRDISDMTIQ